MFWIQLKEQMKKHPSACLRDGKTSVTYEEAIAFAECFAKRLTAPCYGILCETELGSALAVLACLAAGKTAVPLSLRYGELHVRRILEFVRPRYMIGEKGGKLQIFEIEDQIYEKPDEQPAFIMCTSGTTGQPKGVMLSENNILVNVQDILRYFPLTDRDRVLISRPLYHCAVLTGEFFTSLMCGADICFIANPYHVGEWIRIMEESQITVVCSTPSFFQMMNRLIPKTFPVRKVAVSGECLDSQAAARVRMLFPDAEIYHVYGLTEASPRVAYLSPELFDHIPEMLSYSLDSVRLKIVDDAGGEVPAGTEGELVVRGENVMLGYYRNPTLTAQTIRDGWLHTKDMAVRAQDGNIRILGRKDDMIVYAGMNIYPKEIEEALKSDTRVEEVLAYGIPHPFAGQAVAVKVKGSFADKKEVEVLCRKMLPAYEQPMRIELVTDIPKNATGKMIRRKV